MDSHKRLWSYEEFVTLLYKGAGAGAGAGADWSRITMKVKGLWSMNDVEDEAHNCGEVNILPRA